MLPVMSLFDFFFPEQAQAAHLRRLADGTATNRIQARAARARQARSKNTSEQRIKELEDEVAELTIVVEALVEILDDTNSPRRVDLARKVAEIDARDGVRDGSVTKDVDQSAPKPKLRFPGAE